MTTMLKPLAPDVFASTLAEAKRLHLAGSFVRARTLYQDLADRHPLELAPQYMLAELDMRDGRLVTARRRLEALVSRDPTSREARLALAGLTEELADMDAALALYRRDVEEFPGDPVALSRLATVLRFAGQLDEAKGLFRRLTNDWPASSGGYVGLAAVDITALNDGDIAAIERLARAPETSLQERIQLLFALGEFKDRRKLYDEAFSAIDEGNRLRRENLRSSFEDPAAQSLMPKAPDTPATVQEAEAHLAHFLDGIRAMFTPQYLAHFGGKGLATNAPIFIVGMPRSGSTLLEQILSSHPQVTGLGETKALGASFKQLMPTSRAQMTEEFKNGFYRRVGETYLEALHERGWSGENRVIDKMLGNYANIGIIHLAFPNAVIINSMRDPVDTCFSCFRQTFRDRNETTYDLGAVGRQYVGYRRMMAYWDEVLPGRVRHVQHEAVLSDPEAEIRALLAKCDLAWDDACLRFHESSRPVRTASSSQVRRPLFKTSMARWKPYERHLAPLFDALGPFAPKIGEDAPA
jgi:tetratricopeptide (TPR) repeat protein